MRKRELERDKDSKSKIKTARKRVTESEKESYREIERERDIKSARERERAHRPIPTSASASVPVVLSIASTAGSRKHTHPKSTHPEIHPYMRTPRPARTRLSNIHHLIPTPQTPHTPSCKDHVKASLLIKQTDDNATQAHHHHHHHHRASETSLHQKNTKTPPLTLQYQPQIRNLS